MKYFVILLALLPLGCEPPDQMEEVVTVSAEESEEELAFPNLESPVVWLRPAMLISPTPYSSTCVPKTTKNTKDLSDSSARISIAFDNSHCAGKPDFGSWTFKVWCTDTSLKKAVSSYHFHNVYDLASKLSLICFKDRSREFMGEYKRGTSPDNLVVVKSIASVDGGKCKVERLQGSVRVTDCLHKDQAGVLNIQLAVGLKDDQKFTSMKGSKNGVELDVGGAK